MLSTARPGQTVIPAARHEELVVTQSGDEVLVYDTRQHHIHHLNATSAAVWKLCDGRRTEATIGRELERTLGKRVEGDLVRAALTKLADAHLLDGPLPADVQATRLSRRTLLRRSAVAGAVAVPMVVSISAPAEASFSAPVCGETCNTTNRRCATSQCPTCSTNSSTCVGVCGDVPYQTHTCSGNGQCNDLDAQYGVDYSCVAGCCVRTAGLTQQSTSLQRTAPEATATDVPPTEVPPTEVPPTEVPPTEVPPTEVPPTVVPPTDVPVESNTTDTTDTTETDTTGDGN